MSDPRWLPVALVLEIHERAIGEHGGLEGPRDAGLLESALARPRSAHAYGERDIFLFAAMNAHGIARNHPFLDGNKRTAFLAACTFLGLNGWTIRAADADVVETFVALASGDLGLPGLMNWLRERSVRRT